MTVTTQILVTMGSTRLPSKVLRDIAGKQILLRVVERIEQSKLVDQTIIVTSLIRGHPKGVRGQSIELYPRKFVIRFSKSLLNISGDLYRCRKSIREYPVPANLSPKDRG